MQLCCETAPNAAAGGTNEAGPTRGAEINLELLFEDKAVEDMQKRIQADLSEFAKDARSANVITIACPGAVRPQELDETGNAQISRSVLGWTESDGEATHPPEEHVALQIPATPHSYDANAQNLDSGNVEGDFASKRSLTPKGKVRSGVASILMLVVTVFNILAIIMPWWHDSSSKDYDVHMTLWGIEVTGSQTMSLSWDDYCTPQFENKPECDRHKINAVRATISLGAFFAFLATISLALASLCAHSFWSKEGFGFALLSLCSTVTAGGLALWYPNQTKLDTPGVAFIFVCVSAQVSLLGLIAAWLVK